VFFLCSVDSFSNHTKGDEERAKFRLLNSCQFISNNTFGIFPNYENQLRAQHQVESLLTMVRL